MQLNAYEGFRGVKWRESIDVADFIRANYTEYKGDDSFLSPATDRTKALMAKVEDLLRQEQQKGGVLDIDTERVSSLLTYGAGYIDKDLEKIVGLQTDAPLRRGVNPFGGIRMARSACEAYGYKLSEQVETEFKYRTTHNDGVFRAYTKQMRAARKAGIITGLPDAYGRGRIIGDYRRVALYGIDRLMEEKQKDKDALAERMMDVETIRQAEELSQQIAFLDRLKQMAAIYGEDISGPACDARQAVQWLYFGYLAANKEQNGAAMSLGRTATFLDIYIERDLQRGLLDEAGAQELIDDFVIKLRLARHLRTPEYNELFGGDPMWITESLGGMLDSKTSLVTRTSFRYLQTLYNLNPAPEPNLTVLWSARLPEGFRRFCAKISCETDSIQYENDDLMRPVYGNDYAIACCVSAMTVGKQMQFFGARCNLPKLLLLALNGGVCERTGLRVLEGLEKTEPGRLDYDEVENRLFAAMEKLCKLYVNTMNVIHYMHDKYAYEKTQMALHDTDVKRFMSFGIAGLSVLADSLSAIKYASVTPKFNEDGMVCDFEIEGDFPKYGNDDDRVDRIAVMLCRRFYNYLRQNPTYRDAEHTLSALTITSNVVYGEKTGATPDGRPAGAPFAPGANPMHGREFCGAAASLCSVAKLPYECCRDGISNTFSVVPQTLGKDLNERVGNLCTILDQYFVRGAHHLNVNVMHRETLIDAMEHPEKYPNLTIRVSGYAVHFHKLSRKQQEEVIRRTFFDRI